MFNTLANRRTLNYLKMENKICVQNGSDCIAEFIGHYGEKYYIRKLPKEDIFEINDAKEVDAYSRGFIYQLTDLGTIYFDNSGNGFFSELDCENSIQACNKKGFKDIIIKYAENFYNLSYKPIKDLKY